MLEIISTKDLAKVQYVNCLLYGQSGIGKTYMCHTAPSPLIISTEQGLLSLQDIDIPAVEVHSLAQFKEAFSIVKENKQGFETVCVDSLSELAEILLQDYFKEERDPRKAYGRVATDILGIIRKFKTLPIHFIAIAKQGRIEDGYTGKQNFGPGFPGKVVEQNISFQFDLVLAMRSSTTATDKEHKPPYIQTSPCVQYDAKDRSGKLSFKEQPDFTVIFNKVRGTQNAETQ